MNRRSTHQANAEELAMLLVEAMKNAAVQGERSDGTLLALARAARSLPSEVVDEGFSQALQSVVLELKSQPSVLADLLIAAEQFADRAGADRFLGRTRLFISDVLSRKNAPSLPATGSSAEQAQIRARYLALARATGYSVSLEVLENEKELKEFQPLLWLDLASNELASSAFVEKAQEFLKRDAFHPFAILPRLNSIIQKHGAGIAQAVLDAACHQLYARQRYDDAASLIARANIVAPRGWKLPLGGKPVFMSTATADPKECIGALIRALQLGVDQPVVVVRAFRDMVDPVLVLSSDDQEEHRRNSLRQDLFTSLLHLPAFDTILLTGLLPTFRLEDSSGFDWWQDLGPWRANLPSQTVFEARVTSSDTAIATASWIQWGHQESAINYASSGFRAIDAAERSGFGTSRRVAA